MDGIINVLKPPGMTSSDVVVDIRRLLGIKKVGHTGTLDPGAAGVLPVCIGKATRLFDYLADKDKEYLCEITFGIATDTIDAYGKVLQTSEQVIAAQVFEQTLHSFLGEQEQIPPMYSALKINGKKLYDLARQGEITELDAKRRKVSFFSLDYMEQTAVNAFLFRIHCSKGTYIRTLCSDIAAKLGTSAYMSFLLRTRSGPFAVDDALTIAQIAARKEAGRLTEAIAPMDRVLAFLPAVVIPDRYQGALSAGNAVPRQETDDVPEGQPLRFYCANRFYGIGTAQANQLKIHTMLLDQPNGDREP